MDQYRNQQQSQLQNQQYQNQQYQSQSQIPEQKPKNNGFAIAALVCGLISFFINPVYTVSLAAIILGIVALAKKNDSKAMSIIGIVLGAVSIAFGVVVDLLLTIFTAGAGFCSFFI